MKTIITIKLVPETNEDMHLDLAGYMNAIRDLLEQGVEDVVVRGIMDFSEMKKGEPPILIDQDEEPALVPVEETSVEE